MAVRRHLWQCLQPSIFVVRYVVQVNIADDEFRQRVATAKHIAGAFQAVSPETANVDAVKAGAVVEHVAHVGHIFGVEMA